MADDYVELEIDGEVLVETELAFQIQLTEHIDPVWLPKSVCGYVPESGDEVVAVETWFAKKEGLI